MIHQAVANLGYLPVDTSIENYEQQLKIQEAKDYYWVSGEYWFVTYVLICLNISYHTMGASHLACAFLDAIRVYHDYNFVFPDFVYLTLLSSVAVTLMNYEFQKYSKSYFLQKKKIDILHQEQKEIF